MKKSYVRYLNLALLIVLAILILIFLYIFKLSDFNKPIPDAITLPKEVQESIANLKPQKVLNVPILLYHYVEYVKDEGDTIRKSLNITPYMFEQEIKTLEDDGYTFVTMSDLADALDDKNNLPSKPVILTFDDGYRDFYTDVFPILKKYQVKAVAYIVPNFLNKPNNMDTWMLKEIAKSGLVEIGAHTMNHAYLSDLPLERVKYEVEESKKYLEKNLGIPVTTFAYPNGTFDNQIIDVVKKAGFKTAVTTINGIFAQDINRFFLYRIRPGARTGQSLLNLLDNPDAIKY
ncbi:MAG: polysaccharide deacetylase family protein [Candidatus Daviesbacteria bacterium]|nr:polysaccharide deacetylase family protein [Candidatus Daviesbacteria bacterium]